MKTLGRIYILLLVSAFAFGTVEATETSPTAQVRVEVDHIIDLLKDKTLQKAERNQKITDLIRSRFDFQTMSQWILGINWRKATPEQRDQFIDLFTQLLEATYRGRIEAYVEEYTDEHVKYVNEQIRKGKALVETLVVTKAAEIPVNYKLVLEDGEWRVYDVVIEKVSLVSNYRNTYDEIIRKNGFDGLFSRMEKKIGELNADAEPQKVKP